MDGGKDIYDTLWRTSLPNGNFEVGFHIATNVTNFVPSNTLFGDEDSKRAAFLYLVEH